MRALQRVEPDHPVGEAREALHLVAEHLGVAHLEAVGEDHADRAAHDPGAAVLVEQALQRLADARAPVPVGHLGGRGGEGDVGVGVAEGPCHAREAGAEGEGLPVRAAAQRGVGEHRQGPRVGGHRARHVEHQQQPPPLPAPPPPGPVDGLAARCASRGAACAAGRGRPSGPRGGGGCGAREGRGAAAPSGAPAARSRRGCRRRSSWCAARPCGSRGSPRRVVRVAGGDGELGGGDDRGAAVGDLLLRGGAPLDAERLLEGAVERRDVLAPRDERGAGGPVEVARARPPGGAREREQAAGADGDAGDAERPGEVANSGECPPSRPRSPRAGSSGPSPGRRGS